MVAVVVEEIGVVEDDDENILVAVEVTNRGKHPDSNTQRLCKKCPQYDPSSQKSKQQAAVNEACAALDQAGMSNPTGDATTPPPTGGTKSKSALPGGYTAASE
eukprot:2910953-Ditylum_brightwellii.AAC.1